MSCGIYKIENLIDGKIYIGQSINIERRLREHKYKLNSESSCLHLAILEHGIENFSFEILKECKQEELNFFEKEYIFLFNSYETGYNATTGGAGSRNYENKLSYKDVDEIVDLLKNTLFSQEEIGSFYNVNHDTISMINLGKTRINENIKYPIRIFKKEYRCKKCNAIITKYASKELCFSCSREEHRIVKRPSAEQLEKELRELNFMQVGKKYEVSDTAVRKWCKSYGMSTKAKDYK